MGDRIEPPIHFIDHYARYSFGITCILRAKLPGSTASGTRPFSLVSLRDAENNAHETSSILIERVGLDAPQSGSVLLADFFCQARQLSSHVIRAEVHVRTSGTRGPAGIIPCLHGVQAFGPAAVPH